MSIRRKIVTILCTVVLSTTVFAENESGLSYNYEIRGQVVDENGRSMPGVSVLIKNTTMGVGTDSRGYFVLKLKEKRDLPLLFSCIGYKNSELNVPSENLSEFVRVSMVPALNQLEETVVTGTREEKLLKDVSVPTRIIGRTEIQALNPINMESLLQYEIPGLQIGYNSMSGLPSIKYQGMGGEYVLFLVDGERVSGEGSDHNVDFSMFNVENIERIEIIRGAQATIYGSNALAGVINIITKKAGRPIVAEISSRYAGHNGQSYSASAGCRTSVFSSMTSVTWQKRDTYSIGDKNGKPYDVITPDGKKITKYDKAGSTTIYGGKMWNVSQKFKYSFNEHFKAELNGSFYRNKYDVKWDNKHNDIFSDYAIRPKLSYIINDKSRLNLSYIFDDYQKEKDFFEAGYSRMTYRNISQTARLDFSWQLGSHDISAGAEWRHEYLKHYMFKDNSSRNVGEGVAFLQENWKVFKHLDVVAGIRADYHRVYKWNLTPKITVMYRPWNFLTLRAGYSRGFRSPSLKELYQEFDMAGIMMIYGNENLKPEKSNQFLLSAETTIGRFDFSLSGYHNRYYNKISYYDGTIDGKKGWHYVNAANAKTTGGEALLKARVIKGLTLTGAYTYVNDYQEVDGKNTSLVRPHSITFSGIYNHKFGKVGTTYSLHGQWGSGMNTYYKTSSGNFERVFYESRIICTANVSLTLPYGVSVGIGVDNIFNYKDKAADSALQLPQKGISLLGTLRINIADIFRL